MATNGAIRLNQWFGGMSDTDTRMAEGQYAYAENIDIRRDPDFIQLNSKPRTQFTTPSLMTTYSQSQKNSNFFLYGEQGAIVGPTGDVVDILVNNEDILNATLFAGQHLFMYIFGSTLNIGCIDDPAPTTLGSRPLDPSYSTKCNLNAIIPHEFGSAAIQAAGPPGLLIGIFVGELYVDTNNGNVYERDGAAWNLTISQFTSPPCIPLLNVEDSRLYIGVENTVKLITAGISGLLVNDIITFEAKVVALTNNGNLIKVYLNNGRVYYWDGFGPLTDTFQNTEIKTRYVDSFGAYDYVVGGGVASFSQLYISQGLQFQLFKSGHNSKGSENNSKYRFDMVNPCAEGSMTQYQNVIFTGAQQGQLGSSKKALVSRGNTYNGYPIAHVVESTVNGNGDRYDQLGVVFEGFGPFPELVYSREVNGTYGIDFINLGIDPNPEVFQLQGVLYSPKYVLNHTDLKRLYEIDVRYGNTNADRTIQIDYALDGGAYQTGFTIDQDINAERKESKYRKVIALDQMPDDDFFEIQFRITLTTNDENLTPRLYDFLPLFEVNEQ